MKRKRFSVEADYVGAATLRLTNRTYSQLTKRECRISQEGYHGRALIRRYHPSAAFVRPFCFTFSHRPVPGELRSPSGAGAALRARCPAPEADCQAGFTGVRQPRARCRASAPAGSTSPAGWARS